MTTDCRCCSVTAWHRAKSPLATTVAPPGPAVGRSASSARAGTARWCRSSAWRSGPATCGLSSHSPSPARPAGVVVEIVSTIGALPDYGF